MACTESSRSGGSQRSDTTADATDAIGGPGVDRWRVSDAMRFERLDRIGGDRAVDVRVAIRAPVAYGDGGLPEMIDDAMTGRELGAAARRLAVERTPELAAFPRS